MDRMKSLIHGQALRAAALPLWCAAVVAAPVSAEKAAAPADHTLQSYIAHALEHNPRIEQHRRLTDASRREKALAATLPDPVISGGYFISPAETRVGPRVGAAGVSQSIPWPGSLLARQRQAGFAVDAREARLAQIRADIAAEVYRAYAEYYLAGRTIEIHRTSLELLRQIETTLLSRYTHAAVNQARVLKLQVEIAVLEDRIARGESRGRSEAQRLRALLNCADNSALPYPDTLIVPAIADSAELLDEALAGNFSLKSLKSKRNQAEAGIDLARQRFGPTITLKTEYQFTGKSDMLPPDDPENGKDAWVASVAASVPIWVGAKKRAIDKEKDAAAAGAARVREAENRLRQTVVTLLEDYGDARRRMRLLETALLPRARQAYRLMREAYVNAEADAADFLDAQRTMLELLLERAGERSRAVKAAAGIERLLGRGGAPARHGGGTQ
jgi:outer membrane protein TolC